MLTLTVLGSGSKGNAVLIRNAQTAVLIDCGLPIRELVKRLGQAGQTLAGLSGVLITHEHDDHIRSIRELSEGYGIPIYLHERLYADLKGKMRLPDARPFAEGDFGAGGLDVRAFKTSHDAIYPVGFAINDNDSKLVYATDLGFVPGAVLDLSRDASLVFLESNHDRDMLESGRYPAFLKRRILSPRGHLCNADCALALREIFETSKTETKTFVLGHLSEENNIPELAFWETQKKIEQAGGVLQTSFQLHIAPQRAILADVRAK